MSIELTEEQRDARRTRARDLIEERLTETWPAWRHPRRKPNLPLAADIALDALGDLAAEILVDGTMMRALTIRDGVATLELAEATEMVRIFAAGMRGALNGATNYVEMEMTDGATGEGFTVTIRRRERPTPHELRQQADARAAGLEARLANAHKLVSGWLKASADHHAVSHLDALKTDPLMAGMQNGRANQYSDCANELSDVLGGEDPDGWEHSVAITVTTTDEAAPRG